MYAEKVEIVLYKPLYAEQTVKMWRASKEQAIGYKEKHSIDSHIYFLNNLLPKEFQIEIALLEEKVVGLIAFHKTEVNQLYVHVDYQGMGIGQTLLDRAKAQSSGRLRLYTFEINKNAQGFYEKNGFKRIGCGQGNEEKLPDILYEWKCD